MKEREKKRILFLFYDTHLRKRKKIQRRVLKGASLSSLFCKQTTNQFVCYHWYLFIRTKLTCLLVVSYLIGCCVRLTLLFSYITLDCTLILYCIGCCWCVIPVKERRFVIVIIMSTNVRDIKIINKGNTQSQC